MISYRLILGVTKANYGRKTNCQRASRPVGQDFLVDAGHDAGHLQRGLGGFGAPVVLGAEATDFGVLNLLKNEYAMDDWQLVLNLDLRERMSHAPANVLGVAGLALENNAEANNGGITPGSRELGSDRGNFESAGNAYEADFRAGLFQNLARGPHHRVHIFAIVAGGDDREGGALGGQRFASNCF